MSYVDYRYLITPGALLGSLYLFESSALTVHRVWRVRPPLSGGVGKAKHNAIYCSVKWKLTYQQHVFRNILNDLDGPTKRWAIT